MLFKKLAWCRHWDGSRENNCAQHSLAGAERAWRGTEVCEETHSGAGNRGSREGRVSVVQTML